MEVIRIYEVYIDVYFIENILLDMFVIVLLALLMQKRPEIWRIILASLVGGIGAVFILMAGIGYGIVYILLILLLDTIMVMLALSVKHKVYISVIYFQGIAFIYSKLDGCIGAFGIPHTQRFIVTAIMTVVSFVICRYRKKLDKKRVYVVRITENGENADFKALFDTGNLLVDPYTGKPVSIIEESITTKNWIKEKPQKYKLIPFSSIGKEGGLLEGTEVDELIIWKEDQQIIKKDAVVALYKGRLSKDGSFQMILNQGIL